MKEEKLSKDERGVGEIKDLGVDETYKKKHVWARREMRNEREQ